MYFLIRQFSLLFTLLFIVPLLQPWLISVDWSARIIAEFFHQGDCEASVGRFYGLSIMVGAGFLLHIVSFISVRAYI